MLEAPEERYASESAGPRRVSAAPNRKLRRDLSEDFAEPYEDDDLPVGRRGAGVRVRFRGLPATKWGRIFAGFVLLVSLGVGTAVYLMARSYLLHDERFVIPSSASVEFEGNAHVTRAQLLGIFGGDVERNIFTVSLEQRRAELERLPWVAHATVMRLLPNRMRVSIVERTPVAFVRQGSRIGLVDGNGVLLDMPVDAKSKEHYSFPVVTGISGNDPVSTRAARMKIFERFTSELDGAGEKISGELSEVDLSNPEDVQALIPDHSTEILVHFGEDNFLERYRRFKEHLPEWRTLYPKLSSVDMRYEQQVVLQMPPGSGGQVTSSNAASVAGGDANALKAASPGAEESTETPVVKPGAKAGDGLTLKSAAKAPAAGVTHGAVSKSAAKKSAPKGKTHAAVPKHHPVVTKHPAGAAQHHPTQVAHP
ncbi:MAG: Polypeptide-transport-associated domain protein FtsQ-type [Edaphobacter sp.]|nr:Polypeptide-transport-associated domain protein FtsQ-type [Edaphobacter sp.]